MGVFFGLMMLLYQGKEWPPFTGFLKQRQTSLVVNLFTEDVIKNTGGLGLCVCVWGGWVPLPRPIRFNVGSLYMEIHRHFKERATMAYYSEL